MKDKICNDIALYVSNSKKMGNMNYTHSRTYPNCTLSKNPYFIQKIQKLIFKQNKNTDEETKNKSSNKEKSNISYDEKYELLNLLSKDFDDNSNIESKFLNEELGESYLDDETDTCICKKTKNEKSSCEIFDFSNSKIIKYINEDLSSICKSDLNENSSRLLYENCNENNEGASHFNHINKVKIFNTKQNMFSNDLDNANNENYISQNKRNNYFNSKSRNIFLNGDLFRINNVNN